MAQKDVQIHIRARDDASASVKKISESLKSIADDATKAASGAASANKSFGALGDDLGRLQAQANKLKVFGEAAADIRQADQNIAHLSDTLDRNMRRFSNLRSEADGAARWLAP